MQFQKKQDNPTSKGGKGKTDNLNKHNKKTKGDENAKVCENANPSLLFFQAFEEIYRAGEVVVIRDGKKHVYSWDIYTATIYCYLYNRIRQQTGATQISLDFIAGDCNCSISTCQKRIKLLEEAGILQVERSKYIGVNNVNCYKHIEDIVNSNMFKLKPNKHRRAYFDIVENRKKRKLLLQGIVVSKEWTKLETMNFIRNTNYEMRTGEFLTGDKLSSILYISDVKFGGRYKDSQHNKNDNYKVSDELKAYELEQILNTVQYEESEEGGGGELNDTI